MLKKIFSGGMVFMLLTAVMAVFYSPPINTAVEMSSLITQDDSNSDAYVTANLHSTTTDAVQVLNGNNTSAATNWTRFDVFTSTRGQLVNNGYMSNDAAKVIQAWTAQLLNGNNGTVDNSAYVMSWTTSNSLMVNMADYNNSATNSWNNNGVSFGGQSNLNEAIAFNQITSNTTGEVQFAAITVDNSKAQTEQGGLNQGTNTAAFRNNNVNYLNGTLNSGANNSLNGLAKAKTTQHLMSYLV